MSLSWKNSIKQVLSDIMLTIRRTGGEWQDMRKICKIEFTSDSRITKMEFEICVQRLTTSLSTQKSALLYCYLNPSNKEVWFSYELGENEDVSINIYNITGELVRTLDLGYKYIGKDKTCWDGCNNSGKRVASGIYIYVFEAGDYKRVGKIGFCR